MPDDLACPSLGTPQPAPLTSTCRFPDGGAYRIEIPSVEGPAVLDAVLTEADTLSVPVHRVSQGSGVMMLTDAEIGAMVEACAARGIMLCLFLGPRAGWDIGAQRDTPGSVGSRARGRAAVEACAADAVRACGLGVRSLLVADEGVLWHLHGLRAMGVLPADLELKVSVMAAPANPASFALLERLGADTINVPSDLTIGQLAELRAASAATIDFYVEAPDTIGGFVRLYDIAELVRVAAPIYLKFGLRNAPDIYPSGRHLEQMAVLSGRERVRRARLGLDLLARLGPPGDMSDVGATAQPPGVRFPVFAPTPAPAPAHSAVPAAEAGSPARVLHLDPADNVLVAVTDIIAGETIATASGRIVAAHGVRAGHKIAKDDIAAGGDVIKYGAVIGIATAEISAGDHVHVHNVVSARLPGAKSR